MISSFRVDNLSCYSRIVLVIAVYGSQTKKQTIHLERNISLPVTILMSYYCITVHKITNEEFLSNT
jgi:hypothetical protein